MTVKDSKRYADSGGWGYYNFNHFEPKAKTAKVRARANTPIVTLPARRRMMCGRSSILAWTAEHAYAGEYKMPRISGILKFLAITSLISLAESQMVIAGAFDRAGPRG